MPANPGHVRRAALSACRKIEDNGLDFDACLCGPISASRFRERMASHMDREGLKGAYPALGPVRSIRDIQKRIAELASAKARGEWIVTMPIGDPPYYFDVRDILAEKRWPTRQELDAGAALR